VDPAAAPLRGHVDVLQLARSTVRAMGATGPRVGLSRLAAVVLGQPLDKSQQCSEWAARPLSPAQLRYAAADAHVLTAIFDRCVAARPAMADPGRLSHMAGSPALLSSGPGRVATPGRHVDWPGYWGHHGGEAAPLFPSPWGDGAGADPGSEPEFEDGGGGGGEGCA